MLIDEVGHLLCMIPIYVTACFGDKAFASIENLSDSSDIEMSHDAWLVCVITINTKNYDTEKYMKDIELFEQFYYDIERHSFRAQEKILLRFDFI